MNSEKLICFDIDGTVWDYNGVIPKSAKEAVKKLRSNGHIPVICTGRAKGNVRDEELLNMGFKGIIAACGNHVEYEGKVIHETFLPDETVKKVVELAKKCGVPIVLEGNRKHWVSAQGFEYDDFMHRLMKNLGSDAVTIKGYTPDMKANKFAGDVLLSSDYETFKAEMSKELYIIDHEFGPAQGIYQAKQRDDPNRIIGMFEGVIIGTSKARGVKILCDYLGIANENTYAIGDSNNDIEMITMAGTGIAMGNASGRLKEAADYVTADLHDDGLYKALEHFGLFDKKNG